LQDVAAAIVVYERAAAEGVAKRVIFDDRQVSGSPAVPV
jgi:hypothetical protein